MPRVPRIAMRTAVQRRAALLRVRDEANLFGAGLLTGWKLNQLATYSSSTRTRGMISRRLAITDFQLRMRNGNALSEVCSQSRQQPITTMSRAVMEKKLRR